METLPQSIFSEVSVTTSLTGTEVLWRCGVSVPLETPFRGVSNGVGQILKELTVYLLLYFYLRFSRLKQ